MINTKVIIKSIIDPDDNFYLNSIISMNGLISAKYLK